MISFIIPGEPVAQGRARITTRCGHPRMYDAPKSADYKAMIAMIAAQHFSQPTERPVSIKLYIYRPIPRSWSTAKQKRAEMCALLPTTKPDIDNYIKAVLDGLNKIAFVDDNQVVSISATKRYSRNPCVQVDLNVL